MSQVDRRKATRIGIAGSACLAATMLSGCFASHERARGRFDHAYYAPADGNEQSVFINPVGVVDRSMTRPLGRLAVRAAPAQSESDLVARNRFKLSLPVWPQLSPSVSPQFTPQASPSTAPTPEPAKPIHNPLPARPAAPGTSTTARPIAPPITDPVVGIVPREAAPREAIQTNPAAAKIAPKH